MADPNFRDFAGAVMAGKSEEAAQVLAVLLDLDGDAARRATGFFDGEMKRGGQTFMMKALGLRTAVSSGDDGQIREVLAECFALEGPALERATARLLGA